MHFITEFLPLLMILAQYKAHHVDIENYHFQSNSKFIGNFTSSITKNKNGDPLINVKYYTKVPVSREFVSSDNENSYYFVLVDYS